MGNQITGYRGEAPVEFLTFTLGKEVYGVDILKVREVRAWEKLRELHDVPEYVKGVLDLRGSIVPIIDLRIRFGIGSAEYTSTTVIIVLAFGDRQPMGIVVDSVSDVFSIAACDIRSAPDLGSRINTDYVLGMVSSDAQMVMLIDSDRLLNPEEIGAVAETAPAAGTNQ